MEPIDEIPQENFFSYTDAKSFTYGFNISSLIQSIKPKGTGYTLVNPYNREKIEDKLILQIIALYKICFLIFPAFKTENEPCERFTLTNTNHYTNRHITRHQSATLFTDVYNPTLNQLYLQNPDNRLRYQRLRDIRSKPTAQRINDLFMEIDQLGNYTQSTWFTGLERMDYVRLYRILYDIWYYRGQLSTHVRNNICPFHEPFSAMFTRPMYHTHISMDTIRTACLMVIETMVYSGIDDDHRKLGAFHALSAMTLVSPAARAALPWLYESIA
jgi:hypothetical protein